MADNDPSGNAPPSNPEQDSNGTAQDRHYLLARSSSQDPMLRFLVNLVEQLHDPHRMDIGITLTVGGMLISGQLISAQRYFEELGEQLAKTTVPTLAKVAEQFGESEKAGIAKSSDGPYFIHLRGITMYSPGAPSSVPTSAGSLWRGRISAVDGLMLGTITVRS